MSNYIQIIFINALESRAQQLACGYEGRKKKKNLPSRYHLGLFSSSSSSLLSLSPLPFFSSLPAYDLCVGCGPGTFSAALACGYFRSVAFQVVRSTLPVSDVVALFKGTRSSHHKPGQTHSARSHLLIVELLCVFFQFVLLTHF